MDLDHIRTFLTVYEKGSISAAAEALQSSQPVLSKAVRRLEESLGSRCSNVCRAE